MLRQYNIVFINSAPLFFSRCARMNQLDMPKKIKFEGLS